MKLSMNLEIAAPIADVYRVFSDIKNAEKNINGITKIEIVKDEKDFVGTRWKETRTEFGKTDTIEMWVTDAKKNNFYEVQSDAHGTHYISTYRFKKIDDDSTEVTLEFEGQARSFGAKLMVPLAVAFAGPTKKLFMKDMVDLKNLLEK